MSKERVQIDFASSFYAGGYTAANNAVKAFGAKATSVFKMIAGCWEIVDVKPKDGLTNEWHEEDHPRGGDEHFPQRFSSADGSTDYRKKGTVHNRHQ